jgi:hypothetical protein
MSRACGKDHSGEVPRAVGDLHDSQAGFWRHRCAGCAYPLGRQHAGEAETRLRARIAELEQKLAAQEMGLI